VAETDDEQLSKAFGNKDLIHRGGFTFFLIRAGSRRK